MNATTISVTRRDWWIDDLPCIRQKGAFGNLPDLQHALRGGFEYGWKRLLDLKFITQIVTFGHGGLIGVLEQRCEPLDIVVWLLQQLGDGDWVMEGVREL